MTLFTTATAVNPGERLANVDTPALLLDISSFEHNLQAVARAVRDSGLRLRAHAKAHKSVAIAKQQIAAGAVGICCQKIAEAQVFAAAGIADILISNQVIGASKMARVAQLARHCTIGICVDHPLQVEQLGQAAQAQEVSVDIYIELDVGQGRCGVTSSDDAVSLARAIGAYGSALRLRGLQAYHGKAQHLREPAQRRDAIAAATQRAAACRDALIAAGFQCDQITGGGTGSMVNELASKIYTEVQPGSYVLMDNDYAKNQADPRAPQLRQALYLWASVISARTGHAVLDAGLKATSAESGLPSYPHPGWRVTAISDEHIVLTGDGLAPPLQVGQKVCVVPSHCDPTMNLHERIVVVDGLDSAATVVAVWPIDARGALF